MQSVRHRIMEILHNDASATVGELAGQLGMAQVSVRHHLDVLMSEDLVQMTGVRRRNGAGRPSLVYALTPGALKLFPQRHDALANGVLTELKATLPGSVVRGMMLRLAERISSEVPPASLEQPIEERLDQVTRFLCEKGYNARWEHSGDHYELQVRNCPYAGVSDDHPEVCLMDQAIFQHLIPGVSHLRSRVMSGSPHCICSIRETDDA